MENSKGRLTFFVFFSMVVFQEMCCGPVDIKNSEVNGLLKLLFGDEIVPVKQDKAVLVSSYSNFVNHGGYVPVYKNKFKPTNDDDNFDYLDYSKEYVDGKGKLEGNNDKYAISWLKKNHQADSTLNNKRHTPQYWETVKQFRDSPDEENYDSDSEEDSKESYLNNFGYHKPDYNRHGWHGQNFDHKYGYHHPSYNHNHGFHHHEHTSDCYFPFGDHGRRRPHPPPPPPGPRPTWPPTAFPTIMPTATNPPTVTPVIDPRQTTMASIVSTTYPAIDIRFGGRTRRGLKKDNSISFPE